MKILGVDTGGRRRRGRDALGSLGHLLARNSALRDAFADDPRGQKRQAELQKWQAERLMRSHDDLHRSPRYRLAIEFFFNELYASGDPRARDRDLLKVQRVMERMLPAQALRAMCLAIELEVLSQELDIDVTRALPPGPLTDAGYAEAYRQAGRRADRERQIALLHEIGGYLDQVVRRPIIRGLVRLARGPAHAAGFGLLQDFLERGLTAFEALHGADEFLDVIRDRESGTMERLFAGTDDPFEFRAAGRRGKVR
jgi:hypothetical protein